MFKIMFKKNTYIENILIKIRPPPPATDYDFENRRSVPLLFISMVCWGVAPPPPKKKLATHSDTLHTFKHNGTCPVKIFFILFCHVAVRGKFDILVQ